jgi:hypothetical protein
MTSADATSFAVRQLASQVNASMQRAIRDQRQYVETLAEQAIRDGHVHGFIDLPSDGEVLVSVQFPLSFMERPLFTYGLEMAENAWIAYGSFPIHSATVTGWTIRRPSDLDLWVGATIGIVTVGAMRSILHYSFEGRVFTLPVGTEQTASTPL